MKNIKELTLIFTLLMAPNIIQANSELLLSVYQTDKASVIHKKFKPLTDYLSNKVSEISGSQTQIKLKIFKTYQEANEALVSGEVDFARFGPASYILAKEREPNIKLLAMEEKKEKNRFYGYIVVKNNSSYKTLSDLKNHSFAFGNIDSTIGRYLAQAELLKANINSQALTKIAYLGRHDKVFKAVELGDFDAGSLKESTFKKLNTNKQLRVLHQFENVTKPWIARAGLDEQYYKALSQALIQMSDQALLKKYKVTGFLPATDNNYQYVREGMKASASF